MGVVRGSSRARFSRETSLLSCTPLLVVVVVVVSCAARRLPPPRLVNTKRRIALSRSASYSLSP
jgi:hypothetical protein